MNPADAVTTYGAISLVAAAAVAVIGLLVWWWDRRHPVEPSLAHAPRRDPRTTER